MSLPTKLGIGIHALVCPRAPENSQCSRMKLKSSLFLNFQSKSEQKIRKYSQESLSSISSSLMSEWFDPQPKLPLLNIPQKEKCMAFTANRRLKIETQRAPRDRKDSEKSTSSNSSRSLSKVERFLGEDIKVTKTQDSDKCHFPHNLKGVLYADFKFDAKIFSFTQAGEYSTVISLLRKYQGTKCVAKAELRFYVNAKHEEYQDSPVDILMTSESIQVLLLRQSYSKKKSRPKWKPLLFNLSPHPELGVEGVKRSTCGSDSSYTVDFTRNAKGYPMEFAKNVLEINNWSSNTLYNRFKKVAMTNTIQYMIAARSNVQAAILNGEVVLLPQSMRDDRKMHQMFRKVFGKKYVTN
eukprot:jgi/Bigna1/91905/estExt_fgenesh1_pg.C_1290007